MKIGKLPNENRQTSPQATLPGYSIGIETEDPGKNMWHRELALLPSRIKTKSFLLALHIIRRLKVRYQAKNFLLSQLFSNYSPKDYSITFTEAKANNCFSIITQVVT